VPRDAIMAAVGALDAQIASPHDPPVSIGKTERFVDPYRPGRITYITRLCGEEVIVIIPMRAESSETARCARELAEVVMSELEPAPAND
jgi:hypothetical protein